MGEIVSFGAWAQTRRNQLGLTRNALAYRVGCSPNTIKKIERDERRPSLQIAQLLAEHLEIPAAQQANFLRMARGEFVAQMVSPHQLPVAGEEPAQPQLDRIKVLSRLDPLPDQKLFGVEEPRQRVIEAVSQAERPWLVSIEGLGGIGKTSLANEVVHHYLEQDRFVDIAWVSAKQEEYVTGRGVQPTEKPAIDADTLIDILLVQLSDGPYPVGSSEAKRTALLKLLKEKPCLVVIDNLETAADYLRLLPVLRMLAQPSKFLITSRRSLQNETDVFCHGLRELDEENALAFLRYEANLQSVGPLLASGDGALRQIYEVVGGNPLALKLVIGQAHFLPLDHILDNLRQAKEKQVGQLYEYIYWQAWQMLDENGRKLFLTLPIVPNGTYAQLTLASELEPLDLQKALTHLRTLSLVEVGGELREPRYRLHRLTETFLMNEVVRWQAREAGEATAEGDFFQQRVETMVTHWQENEALQQIDVPTLDQEKEGILKSLQLGLASGAAWPIVKPLIFSLTSYMERRGHWQEWLQIINDAIQLAQTVTDQDGEISLTILRGRILQRQSDTKGVIRNYQRVIRLARRANNQIELARACSNLGFAYIEEENWWRSENLSCFALDIFNRLDHKHGRAHTHNHLGTLYYRMRLWDKSNTHLRKACQIWESMGDKHGLLRGLQNLGSLYNEINEPDKAINFLEKTLLQITETGEQGELPTIYLTLSHSYEQLGKLEEAESYAKQAEFIFQQNANVLGVYQSWENLGSIYSHEQQRDKAQRYTKAALEGYRDLGYLEGQKRVEKLLNT
ncbi:MAG: tetratricopeptide repeat protein [Chloroflexota bacterium]